MADYRSALKASRRPRSKPATGDRYSSLGRIYAVLDSVGAAQARESAPKSPSIDECMVLGGMALEALTKRLSVRDTSADTTVTAYDLGRAHALCRPLFDEATAFAEAVEASTVRPCDRAEFVRGFRSAR